ncbi:putative kinesin heavy chain [Trypanosoma vivax]|nr:putative kinesin heavy chain [Trypanosoma vivax]
MDNIRVSCRIRPLSAAELNSPLCVSIEGPNVVACRVRAAQRSGQLATARAWSTPHSDDNHTQAVFNPGTTSLEHYRFSFSTVYAPETQQTQMYKEVAHPIVEDVMHGYNGTVLVYGQTGSGKTFTMFGQSRLEECGRYNDFGESSNGCESARRDLTLDHGSGIIPRAVWHLFDMIRGANAAVEFEIRLMFVEIYMERVRDLFNPASVNLSVREDATGHYVENCQMPYVTSAEEVLQLVRAGLRRRTTAATACNDTSSRSHSVLNITVKSVNRSKHVATVGKLFLVDLAGSERVSKTNAGGLQLEEAKLINKSLTTLGHVIMNLADKQAHIPYRDSKLTRILKDSLGGNSRTALVVCCSPSLMNDQETLSTLRFGARAQNVCNAAVINRQLTVEELNSMLQLAKKEIQKLRKLLLEKGVSVNEVCSMQNEDLADAVNRAAESIDGRQLCSASHRTESSMGIATVTRSGKVQTSRGDKTPRSSLLNESSQCEVRDGENVDELLQRGAREQLTVDNLESEVKFLRDLLQETRESEETLREFSTRQSTLIELLQNENTLWEEEYKNVYREVCSRRRQEEHYHTLVQEMRCAVELLTQHFSLCIDQAGDISAEVQEYVRLVSHNTFQPSGTVVQSQQPSPASSSIHTPRVEVLACDSARATSSMYTSQQGNDSLLQTSPSVVRETTLLGSTERGSGCLADGHEIADARNQELLHERLLASKSEIECLRNANRALTLELQLAGKKLQMRQERIDSLKFGMRQECAANQELQQTLDNERASYRTQLQSARSDAIYWRQRYEDLLSNNISSSKKKHAWREVREQQRSATPMLEAALTGRKRFSTTLLPESSSPSVYYGHSVIVKPIRGGGSFSMGH